MKVKKHLALALGKAIHKTTRILKVGGGSAAPGFYALKLYPDLVADLAKNIPQTIVITGTNGKTTTARMLAHFAQSHGLKVIRNETGSNLERGIASALITGQRKVDLALWELDEAAFNQVIPKIKPNIIVFLNVFRDQLDRYGEVDTVVKKWAQTLKHVDPQTKIYINGDDQKLLSLPNYFSGKAETFGLGENKIVGEKSFEKGHAKLNFLAQNIQHWELDATSFTIKNSKFSLPLPGLYNIYNFLAAYLCAQNLGISDQTIQKSLENFSPAFGGVEKFDFGYIFLIKNPIGATQVFQTLSSQLKKDDRLLLALNDNLADGTDVSWIWDANFEVLQNSSREKSRDLIICSGTRAEDLALRLKYAGFKPTIQKNLEQAFKEAKTGLKGRLFILPTYTAMLELQNILVKAGVKKYYWQEQS